MSNCSSTKKKKLLGMFFRIITLWLTSCRFYPQILALLVLHSTKPFPSYNLKIKASLYNVCFQPVNAMILKLTFCQSEVSCLVYVCGKPGIKVKYFKNALNSVCNAVLKFFMRCLSVENVS